MRRLIAVLVLIVLATNPLAQAGPVERQQSADALWLVPTEKKNHFVGYYADAMLDEPGGGQFAWDHASVGKGHCVRERTKHGTSTSCTFRSWASGKASENFTMDPLLQSAELRLKVKGETWVVNWTGEGRPGTYQATEGC